WVRHIVDDHACALLCEALDDGLADSAVATRDDGDLAFELHLRPVRSLVGCSPLNAFQAWPQSCADGTEAWYCDSDVVRVARLQVEETAAALFRRPLDAGIRHLLADDGVDHLVSGERALR